MAEIIEQTAPLSEVRAELKKRVEEAKTIEDRYPGEITNEEDLNQVKKLLGEADLLAARANALQEKEQRQGKYANWMQDLGRPAPASRPDPETGKGQYKSPGDQFIESRFYREHKQNGSFDSNLGRVEMTVKLMDGTSLVIWGRRSRMEEKALVYGDTSVGGAFIQNDRYPGYIDILQRELTVLDLIARSGTDSDTIEYVREDTFTNAAAPVAEATATTGTTGLKPESTLAYSVQTSPVRTIAHWIPVTNKMLGDAPAIRGIINSRLLLGLDLELEDQILTGDGTGENLTGLLNAGINIQGLGTDNVLDAAFKARTQVRVTGLARPNAYVFHPNDWEAIRLTRENAATATLGNYLMGPPSQVGATTLWGMPVVESLGLTENTGLVGDFAMGATLFDREDAAIRTGTINDQFVRNMQTILAEMRAGFVVWRPSAFTRITGI